jgi:hypothetical protein
MRISDEEFLNEVIAFEFNCGFIDGETEDFENPSDDLEKTDLVTSLDNEGGGVVGVGVNDSDW